jgi:hypothetical protein
LWQKGGEFVLQRGAVEPVRFLPGRFESLEVGDFREVEKRSRHRGDGHPEMGSPVLIVQSTSVDPNSLSA